MCGGPFYSTPVEGSYPQLKISNPPYYSHSPTAHSLNSCQWHQPPSFHPLTLSPPPPDIFSSLLDQRQENVVSKSLQSSGPQRHLQARETVGVKNVKRGKERKVTMIQATICRLYDSEINALILSFLVEKDND